ncbi:MAG TPA: ATP-binding protein, partial [Pyrinomonadaceae bacterium]|nr:ATP-binding protein [Pyrinomonadaceae bacterium]
RRQFLSEAEELIEKVFAGLDKLRELHSPQHRRELIDEIFRHIHRIKGSAASLGFAGLAEIAHEFEHLLEALRSERVRISDVVLDNCERATIALSESLTLAAAGVVEPSRRDLFDSLRALAPGIETNPILEASLAQVLSQLPIELSQALSDEEKRRIGRRHAEGNSLCVVAINLDIAGLQEQFQTFKEKLAEVGEVISTSPAADPLRPERVNFQILLASNANIQTLGINLQRFSNVAITQLGVTTTPDIQKQSGPLLSSRLSSQATDFIRTDLNDLDQLLSATHELSRLTTAALENAQSGLSQDMQPQFEPRASEVHRSFKQLQQNMVNLRMVSLGPTLQRAARAGRAAARAMSKEIEFDIIGADLRLDKLLCDAIADPLVHLVRNAVDHGIEEPEARITAGKAARGKVTIEAVRIGTRTRLRVIDDGRGIDPPTISQAALRLGITEGSPDLDMYSSLRLIFRPGFSTLLTASSLSGRGVGLDIVETAVEQVGGEVRVSTEPGKNSIFEIRLPVTFSLLQSMIVSVGTNSYCVANSEIVKTDQYPASQLKDNSLSTAKGALPLLRLRDVLGGGEESPTRDELNVITCELPLKVARQTGELYETRDGKRLIGVVVDRVVGNEEVLVRNLGRHAGRWYGVAGAAELHDGTIALVLDLPRVLANTKTTAK